MSGPVSNFDLELYTDAAGSTGFGAFFQGQWSAGLWPDAWQEAGYTRNLVLLEFSATGNLVLLGCWLWSCGVNLSGI